METKRSTFATSFYIKRSAVRNRDGKAPIMVKISVDGDDKAVGTKLFVTPDLWENGKAKGKSAEANEINGQLKEVSARLTNHYHRILREEDFVTAEKLRNAFLGVGVMENCILKDFGNMNREFGAMVEKGQRAKSTYNKYLAVYNHFKNFLWEKKKSTDMAYKELTKEIIADFDKYLRVEKGLSTNTLWIYTMPLLSLTDKAWRRGIVRTDPFGEYSLEMQETDRGYLTEEELRTVGELASRYDAIVIEDLAYLCMDFRKLQGRPFEAPYQSSVARYTQNYILMISGSKIFSYAGQRIAVAAISDALYARQYPALRERYGMARLGDAYVLTILYAASSGTSHSAQYALAAMFRAAADGRLDFVAETSEYARRARLTKELFLRHGFRIVYDKDQDEAVSDGFFYTVGYGDLTSSELLSELLLYGICAISLTTTGSRQPGIRVCVSQMNRPEQFDLLEARLTAFGQNHR